MATTTTTANVTPRLRVTRHSPVQYDQSGQTSAGPSRLPDFSQLVNVSMKDMDISNDNIYASDEPSSRGPTPPTLTRSENPAAVLRALLNRLPTPSPTPSHTNSHQYPSERESDFDIETASATTSVAQSSLKNIFSKALREPGGTPQKARPRRNSFDASESEASFLQDAGGTDLKGKRRSMSDDEVDNVIKTSPRPRTRFKTAAQPLTKDFLRERFSDWQESPASKTPKQKATSHNSSNDTILQDLNSSQATPPAATSTPQQSLRMSFGPQFQSNLLDQDSEMQHVIQALDSSLGDLSDRSNSPPPTLRNGSTHSLERQISPRHGQSMSTVIPGNHTSNNSRSNGSGLRPIYNEGHVSNLQNSSSHGLKTEVSSNYNKSLGEESMSLSLPAHHHGLHPNGLHHSRSQGMSSLKHSHSASSLRSTSPRPHSPAFTDHHDHPVDILHDKERNWNSPRPVWHDPSSPHIHPQNEKSPSVASHHSSGRARTNSFRSPNHITEHKISPNPSPKRFQEHIHASRTLSPVPPEPSSPTPSRNSSLAVDDSRPGHRSRSPSPLLTFANKKNILSTSSNQSKASITTSSNKRHATPSHTPVQTQASPNMPSRTDRKWPDPNDDSSSHVRPPLASWSEQDSDDPSSLRKNPQPALRDWHHDPETDDMRETDFSTQSESPRSKPKRDDPSEIHDYEAHEDGDEDSQLGRHEKCPQIPIPQTPRILIEDRTPPEDAFAESFTSPPTRTTPRSTKQDFQTPPVSRTLPDLPAPSSSDESVRDSPIKLPKTPRLGTQGQPRWMQTPKPPGGWLATPKPTSSYNDTRVCLDEPTGLGPSTNDEKDQYLTPSRPLTGDFNQLGGKTPRPPGGWMSTPAPAPTRHFDSSEVEDVPQLRQGLMTPVASLSKGSMLDPKTPGVPGGWMMATPGARRSVMKVRFDSEVALNQEDSVSFVQGEITEDDSQATEVRHLLHQDQSRLELPLSPTSPRKSKVTNIRILDEFGRPQNVASAVTKSQGTNDSQTSLRVLDAMGHKAVKEDPSTVNESKVPDDAIAVTRGELLSRIRQGLDDLVGDFGDVDGDDDILAGDRARIEELNATSRRSRANRNWLHDQTKAPTTLEPAASVSNPNVKPPFIGLSRRAFVCMIVAQLVFILIMLRISAVHARNLYFNSYHDPFNPELHLYIFNSDRSFSLSRMDTPGLSWRSALLQGGGRAWYNCLHFIEDLRLYFGQLWNGGHVQYNHTWPPT